MPPPPEWPAAAWASPGSDAGAPHGPVKDAMGSMSIRRLEAGIFDNISAVDVGLNPFQVVPGRFVDLGKPGFIGHEAACEIVAMLFWYNDKKIPRGLPPEWGK